MKQTVQNVSPMSSEGRNACVMELLTVWIISRKHF